ncbi:thiol-disulfide isomerase/thioredoxin [Flavobacterium nitrogenifigens]|uniref:Thiol-disulfide isomerase/thioredoxin n=2 Tax=Flavobacterium TaxID=237 RepID=A0A7W7NAH6_9FLAO|nr:MULTISPECIES: TlpA disulfide reductase family protein [Flavobacterium]MBB4804512.1 thiol-disulfide isomerase/thioredoxin [Flavobacterium nitrogenifigens]MBB6389360.1 thiol-disulfide isomerase/thioredoxin [Flavobacterium notoginsengisoli]
MAKSWNKTNIAVQYLMWSSLLIFTYFVSGIIFGGNHIWMSLTIQLSTILATYCFIYITKCKKIGVGFLYVIFPLLVLLIMPLFFFNDALKFTWIYLLTVPFFFMLTWFLYPRKKIAHLIIFVLPVIFSFYLFPNVLTYINNLNPKTGSEFPEIKFTDINKRSFKVDRDKIVLLDFWSTKCGICYKKFPDLEKLFLKYHGNKNVQIYSVHVPYPYDDFQKTKSMVINLGYKFPTIFAVSKNETLNKLNFNAFPHYVIIKNNKIEYSGFLQIQDNLIVGNAEKEIDKLLLMKN